MTGASRPSLGSDVRLTVAVVPSAQVLVLVLSAAVSTDALTPSGLVVVRRSISPGRFSMVKTVLRPRFLDW